MIAESQPEEKNIIAALAVDLINKLRCPPKGDREIKRNRVQYLQPNPQGGQNAEHSRPKPI